MLLIVIHMYYFMYIISYIYTPQAIEALSTAVRAMHSDVQVVLLTYSHRIGIYRLVKHTGVAAESHLI